MKFLMKFLKPIDTVGRETDQSVRGLAICIFEESGAI